MKCWRQLLGNQNSIQSIEKSGVTSTEEGNASEKQSMLICFFDQKGIVHKEFVPPGQTVNAEFYVEVLKRLRENVRRKRPDQWRNNAWLLHHDNAPAHAALLTERFLTDNNMTVVPHPPYLPDLAPSDFFLFPKLEMKLQGRRLREECRLMVFENRVLRMFGPMMDEVTGEWRNLNNEELNDQLDNNAMGGVCSAYGGRRGFI